MLELFSQLTRPLSLSLGLVLWVLVAALSRRDVGRASYLLVAVLIANLTADLLKLLVARSRPPVELHLVAETATYAFPSGHATGAAALAVALACAYRRPGLTLGAAALAAIIGLSRLYLRVHWLSDVLAGWALGAAVAWVSWVVWGWAVPYWHCVGGKRRPSN